MRMSKSGAVFAIVLAAFGCEGPDAVTPAVTEWESELFANLEVPPVTSTATGSAEFALNATGDTLIYTIDITAATSAAVTQAHIHSGVSGASGGIVVWMCGTASNPGPAGTPACAAGVGLATGELITGRVFVPANVVASMGVFGNYVNVHTTANTGGEIRGQLRTVAP